MFGPTLQHASHHNRPWQPSPGTDNGGPSTRAIPVLDLGFWSDAPDQGVQRPTALDPAALLPETRREADNDYMTQDLEADFEPAALLDRITVATDYLITTIDGLGDDDMRTPSLLPDWTRGHVLTHLARNADGGTRLLTWARTGEPAQEYPSLTARAAQIEAGADRATAERIADVRTSAEGFVTAYSRMPAEAWRHIVQWATGQEHPAARIADARLCEVLVHHVDLQVGFTPDDWPADFVAYELDILTTAINHRENSPPLRLHATDTDARYDISDGTNTPVIRGRQASLLAWLMGRSAGTDLAIDNGTIDDDIATLHGMGPNAIKTQRQALQKHRLSFRTGA